MGWISRWPSTTPHVQQDAVLGNALEAAVHEVSSHEAQDLCNGARTLATSGHRKKKVGMPCAKFCAEPRVKFIELSTSSVEIDHSKINEFMGPFPLVSWRKSIHKLRVDVQIAWMRHHLMLSGVGTTCFVLRGLTGVVPRCYDFATSNF